MSFNPLKIGDLIAKVPIIQGGMGVGVSLSSLAGAVAKEGGIGILSTAQLGYKNWELFDKHSLEANFEAVETEFKRAKELSGGGIVGFNIMVATYKYEEYAKRAAEVGADVIISGAGLPIDLPAYVEGAKTKIAPVVSSAKAAKIVLTRWLKKHNRLADFVVFEGPLAGGHVGFTVETMDEDIANTDTTFKDIVTYVNGFAAEHGVEIPVIFAGGIFTKDDIAHAISLGASGVQMGTRFVCTDECDAPLSYKERYLNSTKSDMVLLKSPVGMPGRAIKNHFSDYIKTHNIPMKETPEDRCRNCIQLALCPDRDPKPYCISKALINSVTGNTDNGLLFAGANAYRIDKLVSVKELIEELTA
ncbi:MAG: nitronate monooxygenase family protein [Lactobacillales bacterium]|jgi:NAD(P)H-dependent flavin oxidoreductase YrpB (nitropropane dioxygenase family)|nr:nitronate monooxygenase family protein [Lactobacillales bacterium]